MAELKVVLLVLSISCIGFNALRLIVGGRASMFENKTYVGYLWRLHKFLYRPKLVKLAWVVGLISFGLWLALL